jgi:hypothetical protein
MPSVVYEIDSFADAVIILTNPCKNFATWDENLGPPNTGIDKVEEEQPIENKSPEDEVVVRKLSKKEEKIARIRAKASARASRISIPEDDGERAEPSSGSVSKELVSFPEPAETAEPISEPSESGFEEIHYLVSSRHLMLASPWFMRILTGEAFTEAVKDSSDGRYHIQASEWDEEALRIILDIFHIRTRRIPATVSLELLAKISVLVDYYELVGAEVMEREVTGWIDHVRRTVAIPSSYCRDLMLWICISRVFHMSKEFEQATAVAMKASQGWLQTLDLPIPDAVTCTLSTFPDWN